MFDTTNTKANEVLSKQLLFSQKKVLPGKDEQYQAWKSVQNENVLPTLFPKNDQCDLSRKMVFETRTKTLESADPSEDSRLLLARIKKLESLLDAKNKMEEDLKQMEQTMNDFTNNKPALLEELNSMQDTLVTENSELGKLDKEYDDLENKLRFETEIFDEVIQNIDAKTQRIERALSKETQDAEKLDAEDEIIEKAMESEKEEIEGIISTIDVEIAILETAGLQFLTNIGILQKTMNETLDAIDAVEEKTKSLLEQEELNEQAQSQYAKSLLLQKERIAEVIRDTEGYKQEAANYSGKREAELRHEINQSNINYELLRSCVAAHAHL